MGREHILQKRIECKLEVDHVSKETGISTKLIKAVEKEDKKTVFISAFLQNDRTKAEHLLLGKIKYDSQG